MRREPAIQLVIDWINAGALDDSRTLFSLYDAQAKPKHSTWRKERQITTQKTA